MLTALDYGGIAARYFVPRTASAIRRLTQPIAATIASCNVLLTTAVAVDMRVVMRREGKGTGQIDEFDGSMTNKIPPPTELQIPATVITLT